MKLVVFGATGGTGRRVVERALEAGHEVVAVARRPEAIATAHERLRVVRGDVLERASVEEVVRGADAVISAIGPANNRHPGTLISDGTANLVHACEASGVKRLVLESGLMVGTGAGLSPLGKVALAIFRRLNRALTDDKRLAEARLTASGLDYVIVRPPVLDDSPPAGRYKAGVDIRIDVARKLSHADVAEFLVRAASEPELARTCQTIGR